MQNNREITHADKLEIDHLIKIFFGLFNNIDSQHSDLEMIKDWCIPEVLIIKKTGVAEEIYTLDTFIEPRKKILTDGTLTNFEEHETIEETRIIGNIAQRFSAYEKSGFLNGNHFKASGNKFFQFIKTTGGWKINSLIWEDN